MLDKLTQIVLNKINAESNGSFVVLDCSDFISEMPARMSADENAIINSMRFLSSRGYIDVKYSDDTTFCVCSMPKGRQITDVEKNNADSAAFRRSILLTAFSGGLLGAALGGLTTIIVSVLLG